jgi:serine phosphatase RsbU (regulator of sigma subunit)
MSPATAILNVHARQATRMLDFVPPSELPGWVVEEAERLVGAPAALFAADIGGTHLVHLAGSEGWPSELAIRSGIGPELSELAAAELRARVEERLPGTTALPLWLRGRASLVLMIRGRPNDAVVHLVETVAPALELVNAYSDVVARARRRRPAGPAAEIQQDMLPPRLGRIAGGEVAGGLVPAYDVGGDWFDHADNAEGAWLSIADAVGRGIAATGPATLALGALRAARRSGSTLEEACLTMHKALAELDDTSFVTAVIALWDTHSMTLRWVNCGHPAPLLLRPSGTVEELGGGLTYPLGIFEPERSFMPAQARLAPGDRVILYTDGVTECRGPDRRLFGTDGLRKALAFARDATAAGTVANVERALTRFSDGPIRDDATQLVLAVA